MGLLQAPDDGSWHGYKFVTALIAEFLGVLLFALFGSVVPSGAIAQQGSESGGSNGQASNFAPWGNGLTLAVLVYITANVSGGHLNPAVTLATIISRHISWSRGVMYILSQILGAIFGLLLVAGLEPTAYVGMGNQGIGCFAGGAGVSNGQIFGWELLMTFVLVATVYAVAVGKPNFGIAGPFIVGVALWAMALCGGQFTGAALNPARVLGPAIVFHCRWNLVWIYLFAQVTAALIAGLIAWPLYGDALDVYYRLKHFGKKKPHDDKEGNREGKMQEMTPSDRAQEHRESDISVHLQEPAAGGLLVGPRRGGDHNV